MGNRSPRRGFLAQSGSREALGTPNPQRPHGPSPGARRRHQPALSRRLCSGCWSCTARPGSGGGWTASISGCGCVPGPGLLVVEEMGGSPRQTEPSSLPPPQVLERLRILGNHHRRVHPLGLPPRAAQMALQARTWGKVSRSRSPRFCPWRGGQQSAASEGVQRERGGRWTVPCWLHQPALSSCHLGGCGRMETYLARAAGTSAQRKDSVAAGTWGQVRGRQGMAGTTLP